MYSVGYEYPSWFQTQTHFTSIIFNKLYFLSWYNTSVHKKIELTVVWRRAWATCFWRRQASGWAAVAIKASSLLSSSLTLVSSNRKHNWDAVMASCAFPPSGKKQDKRQKRIKIIMTRQKESEQEQNCARKWITNHRGPVTYCFVCTHLSSDVKCQVKP